MTIRVLILDDEPVFGQSLVQSLALCDDPPVDAIAVTTAAEALEAAEQLARDGEPFDAFLIDQRLGPGPDGIDVLQLLLSSSPRSDAIIFTIAGDREAGLRAYQAGAYRYLHKPFRAEELVLVLQTMQRMRETRIERDWLRVIADIAETAQRLLSLTEVQRAIVTSGARLGFERTRLWLYDPERDEVLGADQEGSNGAAAMRDLRFPVARSPYTTRLRDHDGPVVFHGQSEGPSYLFELFGQIGYSAPVGDWVGLPLRTRAGLIGMLMLDNFLKERSIPRDQLAALEVFGRQVAVALERAQLHEREQRRGREIGVMAEIGRLVAGSAAMLPLDDLLEQIRRQIGELMSVDNCFIALYDREAEQLDLRLEVDRGERRRGTRLSPRTGLVGHVVGSREPLLLEDGAAIEVFAQHHRIKRRGDPACCWLGVPLVLEHKVIGAIVVQSYSVPRAYDTEDKRLLVAVAAQVVGALHTAKLKEEADQDSKTLSTLLDAGRELMHLALEDEPRLWHLALTMATAGYALGFNRAALLLLTSDGTTLRGALGIGHRDGRSAKASWKRDLRRQHSLDAYRRLTAEGLPKPTPLHAAVAALDIPLAEAGAFAEALGELRRFTLARRQAQQLPAPFLEALGRQSCAVLPIYAGEKRFGVLVVDNAHTRLALSQRRLDQLETWLAQVALAYENRRQHLVSGRLVQEAPALMAQATDRPLPAALGAICETAQLLTGADCVVIYPVDYDGPSGAPRYNTAQAGAVGLRHRLPPNEWPDISPEILALMRAGEPQAREKIEPPGWPGPEAKARSFTARESISASIAAPIRAAGSDELLGVLYLNYRSPQRFTPRELERACSLAAFSAVTIATARKFGETRYQVYLNAHELSLLSEVLQTALSRQADRNKITRALLDAARNLLKLPEWQVGLVLREWQPPESPEVEAREVRRKIFYPPQAREPKEVLDDRLYDGITGYALRTRRDQQVDDVDAPPWSDRFRPRFPNSPVDETLRTRSELDVLIRLDGQILGLFNVESPQVAAFNKGHHERLRRLADVAALALDNLQRNEHQRSVLAAASQVVTATRLDETLDAVLAATRRAAPDVSAVTIWQVDRDRNLVVEGPSFGLKRREHPRSETLNGDKVLNRVLAATNPIWATEAAGEPRLAGRFLKREQIASVAALPLRAGGEEVGALFFNYRKPHRFSHYEKVLFRTFAAIVAGALRDAQRLDRLQREHGRLDAALHVGIAVGATLDLDSALRRIFRALHELFQGHAGKLQLAVLTFDEQRRTLSFHPVSREFYGLETITELPRLELDHDRSIASRVALRALRLGEPMLENVGDVSDDPDYMQANASTRCELCLPLMSAARNDLGRRQLLGALVLESDQLNAFNDDDVALVRSVGRTISLAVERARMANKLQLESAVAAATVWVHETAHEINREVGMIRRAAVLLATAELPPQLRAQLAQIDQSAAQLSEAAIDPHLLETETLPLEAWLGPFVSRNLPATVRLELDLATPANYVRVKRVLLERAMSHLVRNARQAMTRKGEKAPHGRLMIRTRRIGEMAFIVFANDGPDLDERVRERLFAQRVTTKEGLRSGEGGLGLLFVRWALEAMEGTVNLISFKRPVTFEVALPLAPAMLLPAPGELVGEVDE